jgi:alanyl-tRNA synthetase
LVAPERLRFDFTHFSQVDAATLNTIEMLVNRCIRDNLPTRTVETDIESALKGGATALFEEKYGDHVRVVALADFSKELCGGTHTGRTGNIGLFKIVSESSVASGIRRIEALTGDAALQYTQLQESLLQTVARQLKHKPEAVPERVEKLLEQLRTFEKELSQIKAKLVSASTEAQGAVVQKINGINVLIQRVAADNPAALRNLADRCKETLKSGVVVLGSATGSKVMLIAGVTKDLTKRYRAGDIIKQVAVVVGGSGGGRPDMAQAGGNRPDSLDQALEKAYEIIKGIGA